MVKSVTNCVGSERFRLGVRPQRIDGTHLCPQVSQGTSKDKKVHNFDVFLTLHHSIDLFQITNLMHNSFLL